MRRYIIFITGLILATLIFFILKLKGIIDYNFLSILLIFPSGILPGLLYTFFDKWKQKDVLRRRAVDIGILGIYKREDIGQDNTADCSNMKLRNNDLEIKIEFSKNESKIIIYADYWKNELGLDLVKAEIKIIDVKPLVAKGDYKYIKSNNGYLGYSGNYEIKQVENNKLNVRYWHEFPRDLSNNPDANRGWEIWRKI